MANLKRKIISAFVSLSMLSMIFAVPPVNATGFDNWNKVFSGNVVGTIDVDNEVYYSGGGALKLTRSSSTGANVYLAATTPVSLVQGRKYDISLMAKAEKANSFTLLIGWEKRYSLTPLSTSYNWTKFQFTYTATKTSTLDIMILLDSVTNGAWVDNLTITDTVTGENLIKNSTFDSEEKAEVVDPLLTFDDSLSGTYDKISNSESFVEDELVKVRGAFKYMPVYSAKGITVDGDASDWSDFPEMAMPVFSNQFQIYMNDGRELDVEAISKFAYDNENFYVFLEVTDDKFYSISGENDYWKGDSIQLAFSSLDEKYGSELGFIHNTDTGEGSIYGNGFSDEQKNSMLLKTSQNGDKTIYEAKIPWTVKFQSKPDSIYFDYIVNDNDGDGRRYCLELAPGIAEGKTNKEFPLLKIMDSKKDWYSWIQGDRVGVTESEASFEFFIVNSGEEKIFTISNSLTDETEEITVPANSGVRKEINHIFDEWGDITVEVKAETGSESEIAFANIIIERKLPSKEYAQELVKTLTKQAGELKVLMDECDKKGISYDYEKLNYKIIDRFAGFVEDDIKHDELERIYYTEETTKKLYTESKANLVAYLNGEKTPKIVPHYLTSEMEIDGIGVKATFEVNGKEEIRPAFLTGFLDFGRMGDDMSSFNDWGYNAYADEIGPDEGSSPAMISTVPWETWVLLYPNYNIGISNDIVKSGEKALKITFDSTMKADQGVGVAQKVNVTPGKNYILKGWVKAENAKALQVSANDWDSRLNLNGDYDWKEFSLEYTAPAGKNNTTIRIFVDDKTTGVYFDDLEFVEVGTNKNLLKDGGFETFGSAAAYEFDPDSKQVQEILKMLEDAEENNMAVSLLLSPHYFPTSLINQVDMGMKMTGISFIKYNINAPEARAYIETYLRNIIPLIKDYKSLNNILLTNEPTFQAAGCGDFYLEDWHNFLKEQYGEIGVLNKIYQSEYSSFEEIDMNSNMNPAKSYDYKVFNDKIFADWHKWMADIVHELAPNIPINYKVMGYIENLPSGLRNNGTNHELYVDFLDINGCDYHNYMDMSYYKPLRGVMWYDYMTSIKEAPVINSEDHIIQDASENYDLEISDYISQYYYQGGIHGRYMSTIWYWERSYSKSSDARGSMLYRPDALSKVGSAGFDLNRLAYEITAMQKEPSEIGILQIDANSLNNSNSAYALYESYASLLFNGQKAKFIVSSQLEKMHKYKMLIVPNITYASNEVLNEVKKYIENGGKVLVLGENSFKYDYHGSENDKHAVEFIMSNSKVVPFPNFNEESIAVLQNEIRNTLKEQGLYYISVVDSVTGEPVANIEYNLGVYNGKVIVNLANYGEERTIKLYAGDTAVKESKELRSGETVGENITIGKHQSVTLETNIDNVFFDTYGHWAARDITNLSNKGIIYGISDSRFAPDKKTTRAEFLALLMRSAEIEEEVYSGEIRDVATDEWFAGNVAAALGVGIIGTENFRPNDVITREEMCELLVKCYELKKGNIAAGKLIFTDTDFISNKETVSKAVGAGLMHGRENGSFDPLNGATRAEASAVITRFINN